VKKTHEIKYKEQQQIHSVLWRCRFSDMSGIWPVQNLAWTLQRCLLIFWDTV